LNAREKAASLSYPTDDAISTTLAVVSRSRREATCIRHCVKYCIGGVPMKCTKRSWSVERDIADA
jgi:hypothetical protein